MKAKSIFGRARLLAVLCVLAGVSALPARAQTSAGQLNVTLSVQSSISLIFQTNPASPAAGFCALTNSGTNNVGLDLGTAAFPGSSYVGCGSYSHIGGAMYQVSSAFDVIVTKANTSSANYRLAAQISAAPPANVTWLVNNIALTNTGFTNLDAADNYGTAVTKTLQVQVKNTVPAQTLVETVTFMASAN
jgi:hypothetical protein